MAKYGKKASNKVEEKMHELKEGTLRSGSGKKVKSRKQAVAIGLSEARREGGKVPSQRSSKKSASSSRKSSSSAKRSSSSSKRASASRSGRGKGAKKR